MSYHRSFTAIAAVSAIGVIFTVFATARPAAAQRFDTFAAASAVQMNDSKTGPNTPYSDTGFVAVNDGLGGLGQASTTINIADGSITAAAHGCSQPPVDMLNGYGFGGTDLYFSDVFVVTSSTLAAGTLVDIQVKVAGTLSHTERYELKSYNDNIVGSATLGFRFSSAYTPTVTLQGNYSFQNGTTIVPPNGLLGDNTMPEFFTLSGIPVGQSITVNGALRVSATGQSGGGQEMDATVRAAGLFGLTADNSDVTIVSRTTGGTAAGTNTVTDPHLQAVLPTFPLPTGSATPEPSALALLLPALPVVGCLLGKRRFTRL